MGKDKKVFYNMKLFDGVSDCLHEGKMVLIEEGAIKAIENRAGLGDLKGYERVDLKGCTLLPGLIDNHVHITNSFLLTLKPEEIPVLDKQNIRNCEVCLESGVTTVRDVGALPMKVDYLRRGIDSGKLNGPRILTTNTAIANLNGCPDWSPWPPDPVLAEALGGLRIVRPDTPLESRKVVEEMVDKGADWIKIFCQSKSWCLYRNALPVFDAESFQAIMDTSRECGKKVSCHISWSDDIEHIIEMGVDTAEHSVLDGLADPIIQKFIERDMALIPTLVVPAAGDVEFYKRLNRFVDERGSRILEPLPLQHLKGFLDYYLGGSYPPSKEEVEENSIAMIDTSIFERNYARAQANALRIHQAGGRVGVGTDCGGAPMLIFGFCYFEELKQMINAGFTTHEVLVAATSGNAKIIDMEDRIGRIEKGKWADLIAVRGNPLEDIATMQDVQMVCKGGEIYRHISD